MNHWHIAADSVRNLTWTWRILCPSCGFRVNFASLSSQQPTQHRYFSQHRYRGRWLLTRKPFESATNARGQIGDWVLKVQVGTRPLPELAPPGRPVRGPAISGPSSPIYGVTVTRQPEWVGACDHDAWIIAALMLKFSGTAASSGTRGRPSLRPIWPETQETRSSCSNYRIYILDALERIQRYDDPTAPGYARPRTCEMWPSWEITTSTVYWHYLNSSSWVTGINDPGITWLDNCKLLPIFIFNWIGRRARSRPSGPLAGRPGHWPGQSAES